MVDVSTGTTILYDSNQARCCRLEFQWPPEAAQTGNQHPLGYFDHVTKLSHPRKQKKPNRMSIQSNHSGSFEALQLPAAISFKCHGLIICTPLSLSLSLYFLHMYVCVCVWVVKVKSIPPTNILVHSFIGFHSHGGTPSAGWVTLGKIPSINR